MSGQHITVGQEVDRPTAVPAATGNGTDVRPPVNFNRTLHFTKAGYMLDQVAKKRDCPYAIQQGDWQRWKIVLDDIGRVYVSVAKRQTLSSMLLQAWAETFPKNAPMLEKEEVVHQLQIAAEKLYEDWESEYREDGEEGKDVFDDWEVYPQLAIVCWALRKDPFDIHVFRKCKKWELDVFQRIVPFIAPRRLKSKLYETGWRMGEELEYLIAETTKSGKAIEDIVNQHFDPPMAQELLAYHAAP